jgi:hypothetical protein
MAPTGAARRGPLLAGPDAGIEGGAQRVAPRRGHSTPQQEIAVAIEACGVLRAQRVDLGGRRGKGRGKAHAAPYNLKLLLARASRSRLDDFRDGIDLQVFCPTGQSNDGPLNSASEATLAGVGTLQL